MHLAVQNLQTCADSPAFTRIGMRSLHFEPPNESSKAFGAA